MSETSVCILVRATRTRSILSIVWIFVCALNCNRKLYRATRNFIVLEIIVLHVAPSLFIYIKCVCVCACKWMTCTAVDWEKRDVELCFYAFSFRVWSSYALQLVKSCESARHALREMRVGVTLEERKGTPLHARAMEKNGTIAIRGTDK